MTAPRADFHGTRIWTALPPLPLRNIGTPWVESLEHYVSRLARVAGAGMRRLFCLAPPYDEPGRHPLMSRSSFCGPGKTYERRIANLQALTGVSSLSCGTFYTLNALLAEGAVGGKHGA